MVGIIPGGPVSVQVSHQTRNSQRYLYESCAGRPVPFTYQESMQYMRDLTL
jgi:hypothetical protein